MIPALRSGPQQRHDLGPTDPLSVAGVDQEILWEGILAWELERLQRAMEE